MKKCLSVMLALLLLLMAVSCTHKPPKPKTYEEQKALYQGVIDEYTALLTAKRDGNALPTPKTDGMSEREAAIATALHGIVSACEDAETAKNYGYGYQDMDGNGSPELLLLTKSVGIRAILTLSDEKPLLLESDFDGSCYITLAKKNRFFMSHSKKVSDGVEEHTYYTCRVEGDKIAHDSVYGNVFDREAKKTLESFEIVDGKRTIISQERFNELFLEYRLTQPMTYAPTHKMEAPRICLPLADAISDRDLPVADFSSYAAICRTYKALSTCIDNFTSVNFCDGTYDNLFAFPDDQAFKIYIRLLYAANRNAYGGGYDEMDLNDDGQNELLILNEDYTIKAIFTKKDGKPVLVDSFDNKLGWLDELSRIHVDNPMYMEDAYALYEFTKSGDYNLLYAISISQNGGYYLIQNGKVNSSTYEEISKLYDNDYRRDSDLFEPHEYSRNVWGFTYTPLFETGNDLISSACDKEWYKVISQTVEETITYTNAFLNLNRVTDTQITMNFRVVTSVYSLDSESDGIVSEENTETTLTLTANAKDGAFVFDGQGIKGRLEPGLDHLWLVIEQSTDQRFPAGAHCYGENITISGIE